MISQTYGFFIMKLHLLFRLISVFEGLSYILLLFIAMPMKYWGHNPILVKLLGMPHGILFLAYLYLAALTRSKMGWNFSTFFAVLLASVIPFGTLYVDWKLLRSNKKTVNLSEKDYLRAK